MRFAPLLLAVVPALCAAGEPVRAVEGATAPALEVVARVNGDPLRRSELDRMRDNPLTRLELQRERGIPDPTSTELEWLALRKLVQRRLLIQHAARLGLTVTDPELDAAISALRRGFDDLRSFGHWLTRQGLDDRGLFESVRGDLLSDRARAALGEPVRVSEEELRRYYEGRRARLRHERRGGRVKTFAEARPEIERWLLAAKRHEEVQAWLAREEQRSTVELLVELRAPGGRS